MLIIIVHPGWLKNESWKFISTKLDIGRAIEEKASLQA